MSDSTPIYTQQEFDDAVREGYEDGYQDGRADGYEDGYYSGDDA